MLALVVHILVIHAVSLFVISGVFKLIFLPGFIRLVKQYDILNRHLSVVWACLVPVFELGGAVLLLGHETRKFGAVILMLLLGSFAYAVIRVRQANKRLSCGCYGLLLDSEVDVFTLAKIGYLGAALLLILLFPSDDPYQSTYTLIAGTGMTVLILVAHETWRKHKEAVRVLRDRYGTE